MQENIIHLACYISMFPQLIAGPIIRYHDIRFYLTERKHSVEQFTSGVLRFISGLAKKVLIANVLGETVSKIMEQNVDMIDAPTAWLGSVCYTLQLYYDFSGYSDMAIGLGRMFGFEFQENFNYPYISKSIREFWRRWHISLSRWFRDYLYIPLGGSRRGNVYFNLFIVFLATGLWHGAAYAFIIWGLWHGLFIILERYNEKRKIFRIRFPDIIRWLFTMIIVVLGWTLFKIVDIRTAIYYYSIMFGIIQPDFIRFDLIWYLDARTVFTLIVAMFLCIPWNSVFDAYYPHFHENVSNLTITVMINRICAILLFVACFLFISNSTYNPFIYFRF